MIRLARPSRTEFLKSIGVVGAAALTGGVSGCGGSIGAWSHPAAPPHLSHTAWRPPRVRSPRSTVKTRNIRRELLVWRYDAAYVPRLSRCRGRDGLDLSGLACCTGHISKPQRQPRMVEGRLRLVGRGTFVRHRSSPASYESHRHAKFLRDLLAAAHSCWQQDPDQLAGGDLIVE